MLKANSPLELWLNYISQLHSKTIDLGLDASNQVLQNLNVTFPRFNIVVAGTNGKGSTTALLSYALRSLGKKVSTYTSPHIVNFNERFAINGVYLEDEVLTHVFYEVEKARDNIPLTYFEYTTLAAILLFSHQNIDVAIWEVGMGGRLDAVNLIDADISIVTSVDLDHQEWLGHTREQIGIEKAGVFRRNKVAICGDLQPPKSLVSCATKIGARLYLANKDFRYIESDATWDWHGIGNNGRVQHLYSLPLPELHIANVSTSLQVLSFMHLLDSKLANKLCTDVALQGRMQKISENPVCILDVAHNPQAIRYLTTKLEGIYPDKKAHVVISSLADKNLSEMCIALSGLAISLNFVDISNAYRGQTATDMLAKCENLQLDKYTYSDFYAAYNKVLSKIDQENQYIIVTGSFFIIQEAMNYFAKLKG